MPAATRIRRHGGFKAIRHQGDLVEITESPLKDPRGENFSIEFRSFTDEANAIKVLAEIGGLLCQ